MMQQSRTRVIAIAFLGTIAAVSSDLALAQGNAPRTEPVSGIFSGSPVNVRTRTCVGADGPYLEIRGQFSGTIASSDPRLTGNLDFMANPALVNLATGFGTFRGRFQISDPVARRSKAEGEFHTVVTEGSLNHGFAVGRVAGGSGRGEGFFAGFTSTIDAALNVSGQVGGLGDPRTPAVVQSGSCTGPFTQVP
jgi:hypothetical protein